MSTALITSPAGVMSALIAVAAFWFWLERVTRWKVFEFLPPLIFIYATPVVLSNTGVIPFQSPAYDFLRAYGLPVFIVLMLVQVDVLGATRIMGKGVFVMLLGSVGVVLGGVLAYLLGQHLSWSTGAWGEIFPLQADSWRAFGSLAGSWIGGTGNMTAAHAALDGTAEHLTMAAAADQMVYLIWLPLLLGCKAFADRFNRWARVPAGRIEAMEHAAAQHDDREASPNFVQLLYLALLAVGFTWVAIALSERLPEVVVDGAKVISASTWLILVVTTLALIASATPARRLPAAQPIAIAIIYVYVARVGATMDLSTIEWSKTVGFIGLAYLWISPAPGWSAWTCIPSPSPRRRTSAVRHRRPWWRPTTGNRWCRRPSSWP